MTPHSLPNSAAAGRLFIVSTPIGNLDDITLRALKVLKSVDLIACEDTRETRKLTAHFGIDRPLTSFFVGNEKGKAPRLVERLKEGQSIALVTESGTPGLSDPGYSIVHGALEAGITVEAVPGPSALLAALVSSGAPMEEFIFFGFLPPKGKKREDRMQEALGCGRTAVLYESCHRFLRLLKELLELGGNRFIMVCRELTKHFEEVRRAPVEDHIRHFEEHEPRGEFVIVIPKPGKDTA
ncbi:MAG: 16S rRNA (cytidine(1402)-2'-O)-methyltransferase [Candidatus Omnitrophica bacterium]|nr:16S rRNA (cytidine(1402)-2'-O)-methyltransferase [Candidatus Omnitrophota bacterium]